MHAVDSRRDLRRLPSMPHSPLPSFHLLGRSSLGVENQNSVDPDVNQGCGGAGDVRGDWGVYFTQTLDALAASSRP
jgi:hypothetical protein